MSAKAAFVCIFAVGLVQQPWYSVGLVLITAAVVLAAVRSRPAAGARRVPAPGRGVGQHSAIRLTDALDVLACLKGDPKSNSQIRRGLAVTAGSETGPSVTGFILEHLCGEGLVKRGPEPGQFQLTPRGNQVTGVAPPGV